MITLIAWIVSNFQQKSNNMLAFAGDRWYFFWQYFMAVVYVYVDVALIILLFAFLVEFIKHL